MSKRGIHSTRSTNCIAEVATSNCAYSGTVTRKAAIAPIRAIQRAAPASRSRPTASTARPATIGTQIARERNGVTGSPHAPPVEQHEHADDHRERVVVDVARL